VTSAKLQSFDLIFKLSRGSSLNQDHFRVGVAINCQLRGLRKEEDLAPCKPEILLLPMQRSKYFVKGFLAFKTLILVEFGAHPSNFLHGSENGKKVGRRKYPKMHGRRRSW